MYKVRISGELMTKWLTEGEKFPTTEIIKGLPEGCLLREANIRYAHKSLADLRDPSIQPVLELKFLGPDEDEDEEVEVTIINPAIRTTDTCLCCGSTGVCDPDCSTWHH